MIMAFYNEQVFLDEARSEHNPGVTGWHPRHAHFVEPRNTYVSTHSYGRDVEAAAAHLEEVRKRT